MAVIIHSLAGYEWAIISFEVISVFVGIYYIIIYFDV